VTSDNAQTNQEDVPMAHDHRQVIAIDGPAAAGKSTVAAEVADHLDALLFDTGAIYRAVTLAALEAGIATDDAEALSRLAHSVRIELEPPSVDDGRSADVLLDSADVTWAIRVPEIDANVSAVSAHPGVRDALLGVQRAIADNERVVMVGRDIGTVVVPDAGVKIYLDASAEERARRRLVDLQRKGVETTFQAVLDDLLARDAYDSGRETAPLRAAEDAELVPTDGKTIAEVVADIERIARARWADLSVTA
jgi:cytidylate kinase